MLRDRRFARSRGRGLSDPLLLVLPVCYDRPSDSCHGPLPPRRVHRPLPRPRRPRRSGRCLARPLLRGVADRGRHLVRHLLSTGGRAARPGLGYRSPARRPRGGRGGYRGIHDPHAGVSTPLHPVRGGRRGRRRRHRVPRSGSAPHCLGPPPIHAPDAAAPVHVGGGPRRLIRRGRYPGPGWGG